MEVVFGLADDITVMAQGAVLRAARRDDRGRRARARSLLGRPGDDAFDEEEVHA